MLKINKIICGNSKNILKNFENDSIDLIITSPPYFNQRLYLNMKEIGKEKTINKYIQNLFIIFKECVRICKPKGNIIFNIGDKYLKQSLQLIPYQFALTVLNEIPELKLINNITWLKTNPLPRQNKKKLINSTEPFFHFVKSKDYYYNINNFFKKDKKEIKNISANKGLKYFKMINNSNLSDKEKIDANIKLLDVLKEYKEKKIYDFRMKIRGIHKLAFGGEQGGRNSQIKNQGYTIIRMYGNKLKRDIIVSSVSNSKIDHPAIFPLQVIKELLLLLSKENDIVLDPFCGSGTVPLCCKSLNRNYIGIELSKKYCEITNNRIIKFKKGKI